MYKDENRMYGRCFGAVGWPAKSPGCAVVLGEDYYPELGTKTYHHYVLAMHLTHDVFDLLRRIADYTGKFDVHAWFAKPVSQFMRIMLRFNREAQRMKTRAVRVAQAPMSDDPTITYHLSILKEKMRPETLTLHGLKDHAVRVMEIPIEDVSSVKPEDYPDITALSYAVTAMTLLKGGFKDDEEVRPSLDYERQLVNPTTGY